MEKSPLLEKAKIFEQLIRNDNDRILQHLKDGGNRDEISCDINEFSPDDEQLIEMTIVKGLLKVNVDEVEVFEDIDIPESEFKKIYDNGTSRSNREEETSKIEPNNDDASIPVIKYDPTKQGINLTELIDGCEESEVDEK